MARKVVIPEGVNRVVVDAWINDVCDRMTMAEGMLRSFTSVLRSIATDETKSADELRAHLLRVVDRMEEGR